MNERGANEPSESPAELANTPPGLDVSSLTAEELRTRLAILEADLEDLEEERMFVLGQTGVHLSASTVRRYDEEVGHLRRRIDEIRAALDLDQTTDKT